jgi:hypothetical protein
MPTILPPAAAPYRRTAMARPPKYPPFDPGNAFDAMAESIRLQIGDMLIGMDEAAVWRDLPEQEKLRCFIAGVSTALLCGAFAWVHETDHERIYRYVVKHLPRARDQAKGIVRAALSNPSPGREGDDG